MELDKKLLNFQVSVYGTMDQFNDVLSKARVRIFYKYSNRNGVYITDEFAEKLISSLPYTPVKGIFDSLEEDYTDHGERRDQGRIYGIVPENPNVAWENHLDEDGVERTYACADVLIFTGLYEEARDIIGKPQSMELFKDTLKGEWKYIQGKRQYVFSEGCFLGLQILGEETEPCFEGASFFTLADTLKSLIEKFEKYTNGGKKKMPTLNFKLSNNQVFNAIWSLLNPNFNEEGEWTVDYSVCEIYDDYALAANHSEGIYERVYYTKNNETDTVELGEKVRAFIVDVTEAEKKSLENIHAHNNGTYEKAEEVYETVESLQGQVDELNGTVNTLNETINAAEETKGELNTKIEELNTSIATLNTEKENLNTQLEEANVTLSTLREENSDLTSFKNTTIENEKKAVVAEYSGLLNEDVIAEFSAKISEFEDAIALDKELAYALKQNGGFSKTSTPQYTPKDNPQGGIEEILSKYKK